MNINTLIIFSVIGALFGGLSGWLAGNIIRGRGIGLIGCIIVGGIGAVLGLFVFSLTG